jgi:hypothetical protein
LGFFWREIKNGPNNGALAGVILVVLIAISYCYYFLLLLVIIIRILFGLSIQVPRGKQNKLMSIKSTRSNKNFSQVPIDSFLLPNKSENQKESMASSENIDVNLDLNKMDIKKGELDEKVKVMSGHDLNDRHLLSLDKPSSPSVQSQLRTIQKFDGNGDAEQWLTHVLDKFDLFQLTAMERHNLVQDLLTGEALIWYAKQDDISTFTSFIKKFIRHYGDKSLIQGESTSVIPPVTQSKSQDNLDSKGIIINSFRNQMLLHNLEKLQKFSGKSKQNVSKWLHEFQQAMHICKLTDEEKLTYVSSWLEADARDWFFDNMHLFPTWTAFVEKLIKTFESSGKADIAFNRLRHYEQGITQDVRQYYFEIMKLCKEANADMDEASKLQYLKDGLKPSLRFDVLLKDPKTPEDFLEFAQRIDELKSLDEKQNIMVGSMENKFLPPLMVNKKNNDYNNIHYKNNFSHNDSSQHVATTKPVSGQYNNDIPKPPYQCYKCGGTDHFIRNCPLFQ